MKTTLLNKDSLKRKRLILGIKFTMIAVMIVIGALALLANIKSLQTPDTQVMNYYIDKSIVFLSIKLALDSIIGILFISLVVFMVSFKRKYFKLTKANYIVLSWTVFLFLFCMSQSMFSLFTSIADTKWKWGVFSNQNMRYIHSRDIMNFFVYPFKDFLMAVSFTSIYFY